MKKLLCISLAVALIGNSYIVADTKNQPVNNNKGNKKMTRHKTGSGLEYEVLKKGTGIAPKRGQIIEAHYTGWLDENGQPGRKFDSSVDRGEPLQFVVGVGQVIRGWDEGLLLMKVGDKFRLYIPSELGYGARGAGAAIPPHAALIFDVELVAIGG